MELNAQNPVVAPAKYVFHIKDSSHFKNQNSKRDEDLKVAFVQNKLEVFFRTFSSEMLTASTFRRSYIWKHLKTCFCFKMCFNGEDGDSYHGSPDDAPEFAITYLEYLSLRKKYAGVSFVQASLLPDPDAIMIGLYHGVVCEECTGGAYTSCAHDDWPASTDLKDQMAHTMRKFSKKAAVLP